MHYGLTNTPASFQRFMNNVFKDLLDICVVVYLDDILIYSDTPGDHLKHIQEVLCRLRKNNLFAKVEKCEFDADKTNFLGFIVSLEGLQMDEAKIHTIRTWPTPRKVKEVQSFLGFSNFYRCFIANYSDMTVPLTRLTARTPPGCGPPIAKKPLVCSRLPSHLLRFSIILTPHSLPSLRLTLRITRSQEYSPCEPTTTTYTQWHSTAVLSPDPN